jgi:glycerol-3-phosphate acyltransferase PlsY
MPALVLVGAYLLGAVPFSFLVARAFGVADVRRVGSGNVGATNVMRSAGKGAGALAFLLDAAKGALATSLALRFAPGPDWVPAGAALAAVLGHMYPVWLRFQGGKGVATGAGALFPLAPAATAAAALVFASLLAFTRYVSVGSLGAAWSLAGLAFLWDYPRPVFWSTTAVAALVTWRHHANLERLRKGTENRIGARR